MPGIASTKETSWSGSRKSRDDVDEDKFDRVAAQRGWVGQRRDHARFAVYPSIVLSNRTDGTPHRLVRNGRHKDWVTAWKRQRMEYAPVARATTKGFMERDHWRSFERKQHKKFDERDMKEKERVRRAILSCAGLANFLRIFGGGRRVSVDTVSLPFLRAAWWPW